MSFYYFLIDIAHLPARRLLAEHSPECAEETLDIHCEASFPHISKLYLLSAATFESGRISFRDLPQTGNARPHREKLISFRRRKMLLKLGPRYWPGAYHRKVAFQHIKKLRKLIEAGLANKSANAGDARIIINLALDLPLTYLIITEVFLHVTRIRDHTAEFKNANRPTIHSNALLRIDGSPCRLQTNGDACNANGNRQQNRDRRRKRYVENPFAGVISGTALHIDEFACLQSKFIALF